MLCFIKKITESSPIFRIHVGWIVESNGYVPAILKLAYFPSAWFWVAPGKSCSVITTSRQYSRLKLQNGCGETETFMVIRNNKKLWNKTICKKHFAISSIKNKAPFILFRFVNNKQTLGESERTNDDQIAIYYITPRGDEKKRAYVRTTF